MLDCTDKLCVNWCSLEPSVWTASLSVVAASLRCAVYFLSFSCDTDLKY